MVVSAIMSAEGFSLYLAVHSAMLFAAMTFFGIKNKKASRTVMVACSLIDATKIMSLTI